MQKRIVMTLAMSLDGYIATLSGGYEWIRGDGDKSLDTKEKWDYEKFLQGVDSVVMGHNCYKAGMHKDFAGKNVYVATSSKKKNHDNVHFIKGDVVKSVKESSAKNIFVFGGGKLLNNFLQSDAIDEYYVGIVPVILGSGIPLFPSPTPTIRLHLRKIMSEEGVVVLHYVRLKI